MDNENLIVSIFLGGILVLGFLVLIAIIVLLFTRNYNKRIAERKLEIPALNSNAEVAMIDLIFLVKSEDKETFATLVASHKFDKRNDVFEHFSYTFDYEEVMIYYNQMSDLMKSIESKHQAGKHKEQEMTYVINHSFDMLVNDIQITRVLWKFCTPEEAVCLDEHHYFDFVLGENDFLLYDIDGQKLYENQIFT